MRVIRGGRERGREGREGKGGREERKGREGKGREGGRERGKGREGGRKGREGRREGGMDHEKVGASAALPCSLPLVEGVEHGEVVAGSGPSKLLVCKAESLLTGGSDEGLWEAGAGCDGDHCISNTSRG